MTDSERAPAGNVSAACGNAAERTPSARSLRGLDGINFLMADVRDGIGPYLSIYLSGARDWQAGPIGVAMAISNIAAAVCQVPAGLLVDSSRAKRLLITASALIVGAGCLAMVLYPGFIVVYAAQAGLGAALAVIPPALAAISLGIVGRRLMPARIARNESFNHAGNLTAAALAGALGHYVGVQWIFYLVAVFAVASAAIVLLIKPSEIDHELARGGEQETEAGTCEPAPVRAVLTKGPLLVFLASVTLFHFGNAAMLPLAGQVLAREHPGEDAMALSACIIAAQLVMIGVAWTVGRAMDQGIGRKTIFLVALAVLPVRGLLFTVTSNPFGVVGIQLLDGVGAGIFGVISVVIAADLTRGTGRFNLAQGLVALCAGAGAALSNTVAGYVVQFYGFSTGFLFLAGVAGTALALFWAFMPETSQAEAAEPAAGAVAPAAAE